jgi:pyrimidine operon attenuation protein / uracil phosphoribosyltransferase
MSQQELIPRGPGDRQRGQAVLPAEEIDLIIRRMAAEIVDKNQGRPLIVLVGVRTRGEVLARRLAEAMVAVRPTRGSRIEVTSLDITRYRDDRRSLLEPVVRSDALSATVEGRCVILVDDVLYTGRTARAAIDAIIRHGRPATIQLAVLIDRRLRELPIRPDFVGRALGTATAQWVYVNFLETDVEEQVRIADLSSGHEASEQHPLLTVINAGARIKSPLDALSDRELDVVEALARDSNKKAVGHRLGITESTVRAHLQSVLAKLDLKSDVEAILLYRQAVQSGWRRRDRPSA